MAGFVDKFKRMWDAPDDEYEEYEDEYEYEEEESFDDYKSTSAAAPDYSHQRDREREREREYQRNSANKVVNISATAKLQVVLFKPESFGDETTPIADELIKMHTVVLNLENTNRDVSRRILDFLSGCAYANNGKVKRIATSTYIIIPVSYTHLTLPTKA